MRPNSIMPPLLFTLNIETDHANGSKTLLIKLAKLGYSILYNEVNQYKQFLMVNEFNLTASAAAKFTQFVRDNIDHNTCTGKGTFNGMDIIVCSITQTNKAKR